MIYCKNTLVKIKKIYMEKFIKIGVRIIIAAAIISCNDTNKKKWQ